MSSNHTANYQLSQWERSDKVLMDDFNADNAKLDAALGALARTVSGHTAALAGKGNCRIETRFYTGTGEAGAEHPNTVTFSGKPTFFIGFGGQAILFYTKDRNGLLTFYNGGYHYQFGGLSASWNGNTISWYGSNMVPQANEQTTYYIVAFFAEDKK